MCCIGLLSSAVAELLNFMPGSCGNLIGHGRMTIDVVHINTGAQVNAKRLPNFAQETRSTNTGTPVDSLLCAAIT